MKDNKREVENFKNGILQNGIFQSSIFRIKL